MKNVNYPHKAGALHGFIQSLTFGINIPGIEITDHRAFEAYLLENLKKIDESSVIDS